MPRPLCTRSVAGNPGFTLFKPDGIPMLKLDEVVLSLDEMEALRLADLEGLYQEHAAEKMHVSRQTFGRILISARKKVAEALIQGKALKIEGGKVKLLHRHSYRCGECSHEWKVLCRDPQPMECTKCKTSKITRTDWCCADGFPWVKDFKIRQPGDVPCCE